jgi:hypothetical protein
MPRISVLILSLRALREKKEFKEWALAKTPRPQSKAKEFKL